MKPSRFRKTHYYGCSSSSSVFQLPAIKRELNLQPAVNRSTPVSSSDCSTLHRSFVSHARQFMAFFFFSRVYDLTRVLYTYANYALKLKPPLQETAHSLSAITSFNSLSCLDRRRMARIPDFIRQSDEVAEGLKSPVSRAVLSFRINDSRISHM